MGLFAWIGKGCAWLFKLVALPFAKLGNPKVRPVLRWLLHGAAVLLALACLTYLDIALEFDKVVRAPLPALRMLWLPLLFLMVYSLAWLAWWTWKVASSAGDPSQFPDLDEAWQECVHALDQAKIDLMQTPLYLIVGRAVAGESELYQTANIEWDVPLTPRRAEAPLRVCATRDAVFVSLASTSTSGVYASRLSAVSPNKQVDSDTTYWARGNAPPVAASGAGGTATAVAPAKAGQRGLELIEQSLALLKVEQEAEQVTDLGVDAWGITDAELEITTQRLEHVCHLLAESRVPFCPINGIVALIPWPATETQHAANRAAVLLDRDLQTIERELRIDAPRLAIVTDLQMAPGGSELVERIPLDQRHRRFGIRFPQLANCDAAKWPALAEQGVRWLCQQLSPSLIYRVFDASGDDNEAWAGNVKLYRFLHAVEEREARLTRVMQRGILPPAPENVVVSGLYFAATGSDRLTGQAFLPGILPQLMEMQNAVTWTPAALRSDLRCRCLTMAGYAALGCLVLGLLAVAVAAS